MQFKSYSGILQDYGDINFLIAFWTISKLFLNNLLLRNKFSFCKESRNDVTQAAKGARGKLKMDATWRMCTGTKFGLIAVPRRE